MSNRRNSNSSSGMGILGVLQIVFLVLKLTGLITWSWLVVLIPLLDQFRNSCNFLDMCICSSIALQMEKIKAWFYEQAPFALKINEDCRDDQPS